MILTKQVLERTKVSPIEQLKDNFVRICTYSIVYYILIYHMQDRAKIYYKFYFCRNLRTADLV